MTGYGSATQEAAGLQFTVELRSLNNRYFKALVRLPEEIAGLEPILESRLRKRVSRGSFTLTAKFRVAEQVTSLINDQALMGYLDHLETLREKVQDESVRIDLTQLLTLPGVMQTAHNGDAMAAQAKEVLPNLLDTAIDRLIDMRCTEGEALTADLVKQLDAIDEQMQIITRRAPGVVNEYHQKLTHRVGELMAKAKLKVDENELIREVAIYADRSDISEELNRMAGHLEQFREVLIAQPSEEPAGRTSDFIAQEMLREANTMGSKSNDVEISRAVVEVKSRIDRIKEQVQNAE
jgi:uncharacterized protein (TIGR00255 family)